MCSGPYSHPTTLIFEWIERNVLSKFSCPVLMLKRTRMQSNWKMKKNTNDAQVLNGTNIRCRKKVFNTFNFSIYIGIQRGVLVLGKTRSKT